MLFSPYGPLIDEETFVKSGSGKYGFVRFQCREDAEKAKSALNRATIGTRQIRIGWGDNNIQKHCIHIQFNPSHFAQEDMRYNANSIDLPEISEEVLRLYFERYGTVTSISLPRTPNKKLKGFAFIHYSDNETGEQSASAAISSMGEGNINGVDARVSYGKRQVFSRTRRAVSKRHSHSASNGGNHNNGLMQSALYSALSYAPVKADMSPTLSSYYLPTFTNPQSCNNGSTLYSSPTPPSWSPTLSPYLPIMVPTTPLAAGTSAFPTIPTNENSIEYALQQQQQQFLLFQHQQHQQQQQRQWQYMQQMHEQSQHRLPFSNISAFQEAPAQANIYHPSIANIPYTIPSTNAPPSSALNTNNMAPPTVPATVKTVSPGTAGFVGSSTLTPQQLYYYQDYQQQVFARQQLVQQSLAQQHLPQLQLQQQEQQQQQQQQQLQQLQQLLPEQVISPPPNHATPLRA